ncbi:hypothetical protein [Chlamydiifrater phoenicopteri]|uniref:hypothetical protein n=1 Tax=Chlamydiifrater phoenicopteri TaxID=2681469 RepID=UPI001BCE2F06|nr:hypothetical protein [Chlamydiifrater phoenicopteri]
MRKGCCSKNFISLLEELVERQAEKVRVVGESVIPTLTSEDLLQPMDFPELECHAAFRFEEGVLCGLREALAAARAGTASE